MGDDLLQLLEKLEDECKETKNCTLASKDDGKIDYISTISRVLVFILYTILTIFLNLRIINEQCIYFLKNLHLLMQKEKLHTIYKTLIIILYQKDS